VIWATPVYALRPGVSVPSSSSEPSLVAKKLWRSSKNVTCHRAELELRGPIVAGEYVLMASNDYGARDAVIVLVGQDGQVSAGHVARLQAILWTLIALLPLRDAPFKF